MKIGLQTWGSDGDVRPFIALAGGLKANGHEVTLVITNPEKKDYSFYGKVLNIKIIHAYHSYVKHDNLSALLIQQNNPVKLLKCLYEDLFALGEAEIYAAAQKLCRENDMVIGHFFIYPLQLAAEKARRPHGMLMFSPTTYPSRFLTPVGFPRLGNWLNPLWWKMGGVFMNTFALKYINRFRSREQSPKIDNFIRQGWQSKRLSLLAISPTLFERPPDWKENLQICGFFSLPKQAETWVMPSDLKRFIAASEPPVFMTFGSVNPMFPQQSTTLLLKAAKVAGCRAIIQAQWDQIADFPEDPNIYRIIKIPHHQIFPHCAAVVHHGGAGTTHSASFCGCPSIIIEHVIDQLFWGRQLERLGIAPKVLHNRSVTAEKLAKKILAVLNSAEMKKRAQAVGESMQKENGVKQAVRLIEKSFSQQARV